MSNKNLVEITRDLIAAQKAAATDPNHPLNLNMQKILAEEVELLKKIKDKSDPLFIKK